MDRVTLDGPTPKMVHGDVVTVSVDALVAGDTPRLNGVDDDHVQLLTRSDRFPPLLVHRGSMRVVDGAHRLAAAKRMGWTTVDVRFIEGDTDAVFIEAVRANSAHGLPLTLADRKAAASRIVCAHPEWSDRIIAGFVGLSPKTVGAARRRLSEEIPQSVARVGRDGRVRRVATRPEPGGTVQGRGHKASRRRYRRDQVLREENDVDRSRATLLALRQDPALRMTETGRFLLRLLELHFARTQEWEKLSTNLPPHRADLVAGLAEECARTWLDFAEKIVSQIESGSREDAIVCR